MQKKIIFLISIFLIFSSLKSTISQVQLPPVQLPRPISGLQKYDEDKTCKGYTLLTPIPMLAMENQKIRLIDMDGKVVKTFGIYAFPAKMLPGGYLIGRDGYEGIDIMDSKTILEVDWNGNVLWSFDRWWQDENGVWYSRQHHDYEREGFPTGYYSPYVNPKPLEGSTLVLAHEYVDFPLVTDRKLIDDVIYEVDENGNLVPPEEGGFFWRTTDHFDELGFDEDAIEAMRRSARNYEAYDWFHMNSISLLGENKWYDQGDERFNPENIMISSRNTNIVAIIDRDTGKIVWQIGPEYENEPYSKLGKIIGQHHPHMIQKGLDGAGNILVFDNGGAAGFGSFLDIEALPNIFPSDLRFFSRVIEFDPITYEIKWEYIDRFALTIPLSGEFHRFFSVYISSAQRLPNGNTLIDEGATGRIIEVTKDGEVVWEYISPYVGLSFNAVYRAYRVPPKWLKDENGNMLKDDNGKPLIDYYKNSTNPCW
ncbi:MAG: arylsulfotransferase family protein [Deferribacterota bacterium]|nr:arylsulfotransferase family protein [Deferribacterota bacterium]